jgi:ATP-binding cassette subfamily B protein
MAEPSSTFFQSDQVEEQPHRHTLLVRLVGYLKPYWPGLVALLLLMVAGAVLDVLPSEFTLRLIDRYLANGSMRGAGPLVAAFLGFVLLGFVVQTARFGLLAWVGQRAMLDLRLQLFSHLMKRSTHFFHRNPVGRLMTRVISDVQNLNEMFSSGFVAIVGDALSLTAIVVWMFSKHRGLALVAVGIMPLLLLATEIFRRYASAAYRETQGRYAAIQAFLQEQLSGMALVQMNAREVQSRQLFRDFNQKYLDAFLRTIFAYAVFFPVVEFITNGTLAALIFYAGFKLQLGTLTLGLLLAFIQQSGRFFRPIRELAERYNVMQTALASSERIFKLLDDTDQIPEPAEPEPVAFQREIRLEGVGFAYEAGGRRVVRGLSGVIPKGKRVAVVGHTGAGKSTLINLLMRFYDVEEGRITVDGVDLRAARLKDLRALFGLVLQDVFIFSGTLEENITLGRPLDRKRLDEVLAQSQLEDMVGRLAEGLRTQVGERGQKLSAGERQLVAFARMLYQEPAILLLDEATANIDSETEHKIQRVIERVSHRLTTFTIAHRLSTIKDADEIWVMDQGQLVERGDHDGLMAQQGIYAKLVRLQFEGEEARSA